MQFEKKYLEGIKTPIIVPKTVRFVKMERNKLRYLDYLTGTEFVDELHFYHGKNQLILNRFRKFFPIDVVLVMLFGPNGNLFLQKRGKSGKWAPGKIDLVSVAGACRAILVDDHFEQEIWEDAALREVKEETFIEDEKLKKSQLDRIGEHSNVHTADHQMIFVYKLDATLEELNKKLEIHSLREVDEWFEQSYEQTMEEYFSDGVSKYAGGEEMRPANFISNEKIKKKLDEFHTSIANS